MNLASILEISMWLVPIELGLGIVLGVYFFSSLTTTYRYLLFYLVVCLVVDILSRVLGELYGNNLTLIVVFSFLELICFYFLLRRCYFKRRVLRHSIMVFLASLYMFGEIFLLYNVSVKEFQSYSKTLGSFVIVLMIVDFLFELVRSKQLTSKSLRSNSIFIFYFSINMIFFLPINFLINVPSSIKFYLWCANLFVTVLFYSFIVWELWRNGLKQKQLQLG